MESITVAVAREMDHRQTTTSIGTVLALRSVMLKNELAGTVREVRLTPGQIVEAGTLLVALDVSVEEAELQGAGGPGGSRENGAPRRQNLIRNGDNAGGSRPGSRRLGYCPGTDRPYQGDHRQKDHSCAVPGRVGIADVHPGQYLDEGTLLTTLRA